MANTIAEFLVAIGFSVDESSNKKFKKSVDEVSKTVEKLAKRIAAAAAAVTAGVLKMASDFDNLYWQSQKLGSAANDIKGLGYAFSQLGGSVGDANAAMNSIANFTFTYGRGAVSFLERLGVSPAHIGNAVATMKDLEVIFRRMVSADPVNGLARANAFASALGISPDQLRIMLRDTGEYEEQYKQIVDRVGKSWGVSFGDMTDDSNKFMTQLRLMKAELELNLYAAFYKLEPMIEKVVKKIVDWLEKSGNDGTFEKFADNISHVADTIMGLVDKVDLLIRRGSVLLGIFAGARAGAAFGPWGALIGAIAGGIGGHYGANWLLGPSGDSNAPAASPSPAPTQTGPDGKWHFIQPWSPSGGSTGAAPLQGFFAQSHPASNGVATRNNPGNLRSVAGPFRTFSSVEEGTIAMGRQLETYQMRDGLNTIAQIITRYAPHGENNTLAYIQQVARSLGINANANINLKDQNLLAKLMHAMIGVEQGHEVLTTSQLVSLIARNSATIMRPYGGAPRGITINQNNHFNAHGSDSRNLAQQVGHQNSAANQRLFANLAPLAQ